MNGLVLSRSDYVEASGFFNFYPKVSTNGSTIAYLSNKGRDHSLVSLYLKSESDSLEIASIDEHQNHDHDGHTHALSTKPAIPFIATSFSFAPDGNKIVYSVNKKNEYGEDYRDLFIYDIASKKKQRITESARMQSPAWVNMERLLQYSMSLALKI